MINRVNIRKISKQVIFSLYGILLFVPVYAADVPFQLNAAQPVAFINVNVVTMLDENILSGQTVLINDG